MKKMDRILSLLAFLALYACTVAAQGSLASISSDTGQHQSRQVKLTSYRLASGLRVLLAPDATASGVAVNLSFDVGSRNETPEQAGFTNLLQNIILQNLRQTVESQGGETETENLKQLQGTTNQERTSYFSELTASQLDVQLSAFARQLHLPEITQTKIDEQRLIILNQCQQASESPFGRVQATLLELSHHKFAYKHDTTCSLSKQSPLSPEAVRRFITTYYAPNNAVLVIVGDFRESEIKQTVKKHFGSISRQAAPPQVEMTNQPSFSLERRRILSHSRANPPFYMSAYVTVPSDHPDWYALNLLGDIMGQGNTSRLYTALVAKNLASSAPEGASELRGQSLFQVGARVSPGVSVAMVEAVIDTEIARIQEHGVTEAEMVKARAQERDYSAEQLRTPLGKANFLARATIYYHDPHRINTELGRMLAVTAKDVQRVARKYLVKTNRAVVIVQSRDSN
jgi:predicted Zn-dependent peptidase